MTADTSAVPDRIVSDEARSYHMSAEQFRQHGRSVVDWIADYWEGVEERPVFPDTKPGDTLDKLPLQAPLEGESFEVIMRDFNELIMPAMTNWQSPNFFAYFTANTSPVSVWARHSQRHYPQSVSSGPVVQPRRSWRCVLWTGWLI